MHSQHLQSDLDCRCNTFLRTSPSCGRFSEPERFANILMRGPLKTQVNASVSCKWIAGEPHQEAGRRTGNAAKTHPTTDTNTSWSKFDCNFCRFNSWAWPLKSKPPTKACSVFLLKGLSWQMERLDLQKSRSSSAPPRQGSHQWLSYPGLGQTTTAQKRMSDSWSVPGWYRILHVQSARKRRKKLQYYSSKRFESNKME